MKKSKSLFEAISALKAVTQTLFKKNAGSVFGCYLFGGLRYS